MLLFCIIFRDSLVCCKNTIFFNGKREQSFFFSFPFFSPIYIILFIKISSTSQTPCMEYSEKLNTDVRKDVGIESNSTLYATRRVCHFYVYVTFIQVTLNCFVLLVFCLFWPIPFARLVQTKTSQLLLLCQPQTNNHCLFPVSHTVFAFQKRKFWVINLHRSVYCIINISNKLVCILKLHAESLHFSRALWEWLI